MQVGMTNPVDLDPATPETILTSSNIVMEQLALGVHLILLVTHHPNAPGNTIQIDTLDTIPSQK